MGAPELWGDEFLVNTITTGNQNAPAVAALANGQFVAVWASGPFVMARVYDADGSPATPEFTAGQDPGASAIQPVVTALNDGRFVVAWERDGDIIARIFNLDGTTTTPEFTVNTITANLQFQPAIAALDNGGFVITWTHEFNPNTGDLDIRARAFDAAGDPLGEEFIVEADSVAEHSPVVAGLANSNGRFAIAWVDLGPAGESDGSGTHIRAQIFSGNGSAVTDSFRVNTFDSTGNQVDPAIAARPDGTFVIAWASEHDDAIRGLTFNGSGKALLGGFSTAGSAAHGAPAITAFDHSFFVAFDGDNGSTYVGGRQYGGISSLTGFLQVNMTGPGVQHAPTVATLADGRVVVLWTDSGQNPGDTSGDAVRGQIIETRSQGVQVNGTDLDDQLIGTTFDDEFNGGDGDDFLVGAGGDDVLKGGGGSDALHGTIGNDTANYWGSQGGVYVDLATGDAFYNDAEGDTLSSIENLGGSQYSDILSGHAQVNRLDGGPGNDRLKGVGGDDILTGGLDQDELFGGDGSDTAVFSGNRGDVIITPLANGDVEVADQRIVPSDGRDLLRDVENATFADGTFALSDLLPVAPLGDVLWRHADGTIAIAGHDLMSIPSADLDRVSIAGVGDFDADGDADLLMRERNAVLTRIYQDGALVEIDASPDVGAGWNVRGAGDFDADGDADVLWRNDNGQVVVWEMQDGDYVVNHNQPLVANGWQIAGTGDFDRDGDADILWHNNGGQVVTWEMEDGGYVVNHNMPTVGTGWRISGTGDFDADGDADVLWRNNGGQVVTWEIEDAAYVVNHNLPAVSSSWDVAGAEDFDSDGDADILWRSTEGQVVTWEMQGGGYVTHNNHGVVWSAWRIAGTGEFDLV